jgi:hypothetical protein
MKQQFVVTHTIGQTEIPTSLDSGVTNTSTKMLWPQKKIAYHHHHLPPWARSLELFLDRRVAIVSRGVQDFFFL